jgi:hydroxymethylpyrimidine/phosphomethylpyrimidine kinase
MQVENSRPAILCFAGLDPSGGAGLQADIEAIASCGGHALPIATCLTVQNSSKAFASQAVDINLVQQQAEALLEDTPIAGCKIGVLPTSNMVQTIVNILSQTPDIPIVLDPVIHATHGIRFCDEPTVNTIKEYLLPYIQVITPNQVELQQLASIQGSELENAQDLCARGTDFVFVTGADQAGTVVKNTLYNHQGVIHQSHWEKLPHSFHGSGCTLSSALSCFLALGFDTVDAIDRAQQYTWRSLQHADAIGTGQFIPKRV